jgi:tetratricopeptide (TPR) repeat protein
MKPFKIIFIYLALTISVLLVFWQVRNFDFVEFDDPVYVYENRHVTNGLTQDGVIWAFTAGHATNWHPVTWLSLMLDCQVFGPNPGRMHLVNVFFHLANTVLLFAVLKKMTGSLWPSAFVAAAFALHPMHVESVAWITERKDVLSAFFLLLTIAAYAGYVKRPSGFRYAAALVLFALGLMAKPMLVTLPFVLLLLDYWPLNRFEGVWPQKNSSQSAPAKNKRSILYRLIMEKVPFVAFSVISSVITFLVQRSGSMPDIEVLPLESRFANALLSYVRYIGKMFWPVDMAIFYPFEPASGIQLMLCVLLLIGVTTLILFLGRRRKYLPVGWFWFIGTLIPVIGLVQVGLQAYADRYTYIPYIGLFMMIAWGLPDVLSGWHYRRAVLGVLMVGVLTAGGLCAYRQISYWKDSVTLFSHALKVTQNNFVMYNTLGAGYDALGRRQEAIEAYLQAIRIKPNIAHTHNNLGAAYYSLGRYDQAIKAYQRGISIEPEDANAYNNLGAAYDALGRRQEALEAYLQAVRIDPNNVRVYCNLGLSYSGLGRHAEAIAAYQQAVKIKSDDAKLHNSLGVAYYALGRYEDAARAFSQAIQVWPQYADAYNNLGEAYSALARYKEAIAAYQQAIRINPQHADAHLSLGLAYVEIGDTVSATKEHEILNSLDIEKARQISRKLKLDQDGQTDR